MDVYLGGEVATGVDLVIHVEGGVLGIAEVTLGVSVIHAARDFLLVVTAGEHTLPLLAVADCRAGVLAERQLTLGSDLGVAEHCQRHELVVVRGLGVVEDFRHHLVVFATEHERVVMGGLAAQHGQRLGIHHEELVASPVFNFNIVGGEMIILGRVRAEGEHLLVMERFGCHGLNAFMSNKMLACLNGVRNMPAHVCGTPLDAARRVPQSYKIFTKQPQSEGAKFRHGSFDRHSCRLPPESEVFVGHLTFEHIVVYFNVFDFSQVEEYVAGGVVDLL